MNDHEVQKLQNIRICPRDYGQVQIVAMIFPHLGQKRDKSPKHCFHFLFIFNVLPPSCLFLIPYEVSAVHKLISGLSTVLDKGNQSLLNHHIKGLRKSLSCNTLLFYVKPCLTEDSETIGFLVPSAL